MDALAHSVYEQAAEFHRHGFVCLRNALAHSVVAELVAGVERSRHSRGIGNCMGRAHPGGAHLMPRTAVAPPQRHPVS